MFLKLLTAALIAAAFLFLLWLLRGFMLSPMRVGKNTSLSVHIRVSGPEPALEDCVDALLWLRENGTLKADLVIEDAGMDGDTALAAGLLAKAHPAVTLARK